MTDESATAKKGGRPPKYPGEGKRPTITFRCRNALQEKLQASAQISDRSVSEEIERRLDQSFDAQENVAAMTSAAAGSAVDKLFDKLFDDAGGAANFMAGINFARMLSNVQNEADNIFSSNEAWFKDRYKRRHVEEEAAKNVEVIIRLLVERLDPESAKPKPFLSSLSSLGALFNPPTGEAAEEQSPIIDESSAKGA